MLAGLGGTGKTTVALALAEKFAAATERPADLRGRCHLDELDGVALSLPGLVLLPLRSSRPGLAVCTQPMLCGTAFGSMLAGCW